MSARKNLTEAAAATPAPTPAGGENVKTMLALCQSAGSGPLKNGRQRSAANLLLAARAVSRCRGIACCCTAKIFTTGRVVFFADFAIKFLPL